MFRVRLHFGIIYGVGVCANGCVVDCFLHLGVCCDVV